MKEKRQCLASSVISADSPKEFFAKGRPVMYAFGLYLSPDPHHVNDIALDRKIVRDKPVTP
jgi:hypothetical protein